MSKHPVFCSVLKQISDDHQYPDDPFVALADFKVRLEKARKRTVHELLRKTLSSQGAKLLTGPIALRACRNRHLGTLMHCCETWEPVGNALINALSTPDHCEPHALKGSQKERQAEISNLPWTQTEKYTPWRSADLVFVPGAPRNQRLVFTLLPMRTVILWKTKTNRAGDYVNIGPQSFRRALKAKGTFTVKTSCGTSRKLLTTHAGKLTETYLMNSWPQKKGIRSRSR